MHLVFPGVFDTIARALRPVSRLISELLPTLLRPITANSGYKGAGHWSNATDDFMNSADVTLGDGRRIVFFLAVWSISSALSSGRTGVPYDAGLSSSPSSLNDLYS